jgi:hypothetical protein
MLSTSCVSECSSTVKLLPQTVIESSPKVSQNNCGYDFSKEPDSEIERSEAEYLLKRKSWTLIRGQSIAERDFQATVEERSRPLAFEVSKENQVTKAAPQFRHGLGVFEEAQAWRQPQF